MCLLLYQYLLETFYLFLRGIILCCASISFQPSARVPLLSLPQTAACASFRFTLRQSHKLSLISLSNFRKPSFFLPPAPPRCRFYPSYSFHSTKQLKPLGVYELPLIKTSVRALRKKQLLDGGPPCYLFAWASCLNPFLFLTFPRRRACRSASKTRGVFPSCVSLARRPRHAIQQLLPADHFDWTRGNPCELMKSSGTSTFMYWSTFQIQRHVKL